MNAQTVHIRLSYDVSLEDRGDHWAALIHHIGATVYAKDKQSALKRADDAIAFLVECFKQHASLGDFRKYLDNHGIQHNITEVSGPENVNLAWFRPYRREDAFAFA